MNRLALSFILSLSSHFLHAQEIRPLPSGPKASFRGLSVVNDKVAWVSGSKGSVGRTLDGGEHWEWITVPGYDKNDFRDIEAFDANIAVIMSVASPGYILKTWNGGKSWKAVYTDTAKEVFMDAMDFRPDGSGIVIGDPIQGRLYTASTKDSGSSWTLARTGQVPLLKEGEAFFASSGTNIRVSGRHFFLASGGLHSSFFSDEIMSHLPLVQGRQSTGANSIAIWSENDKVKKMVVVGGDFSADSVATDNCFYSVDNGKTWQAPIEGPHGYRSCVEFIDANRLISCGTSGVDVSEDGGIHWRLISKESYHVVRKAKNGKALLLAGAGGRLAKLKW
jgi:photosystem II stability/assembly factor-like uncharacterized protein